MNKFLSMLAVACTMLIGSSVYAQSVNNNAPATAPAKQCAKSAGAAGCCKDKAAAGTACTKGQANATAAPTCTKGQAASAAATPVCTKGQTTAAAEHKCAGHSATATVQEGESQVLSEKMTNGKRNNKVAKANKTKANATATPTCAKSANGAKCCKDKAAAANNSNIKVTEQ